MKFGTQLLMTAAAVGAVLAPVTAHASEAGVVTAMSEKIYLENSGDSTVLANMLEGTSVEVILTVTDDTGGVWYYVRTDAGLEGYMPAGSVSVAQAQQAADTQVQQAEDTQQEGNAGNTQHDENIQQDNDTPVQENDGNDDMDYDNMDDNGEQTPQGEGGSAVTYTLTTLDNVNIRQEPAVSSAQLGNIIRDTEVEYTAAYTNEEGEVWYAVTYQGISGYVTADAVDTGNSAPEPQPWTADAETDADNGENAGNDTDTGTDAENLTQTTRNQTTQSQAAEQSENVTTEQTAAQPDATDETADIQTQETQTAEEAATGHRLRLPDLFEITLCAGIIACIAAITRIIQKIRPVFRTERQLTIKEKEPEQESEGKE